jgi:hypothetical protein
MDGKYVIELPMIARTLCREAVELANNFVLEMGESHDIKADIAQFKMSSPRSKKRRT